MLVFKLNRWVFFILGLIIQLGVSYQLAIGQNRYFDPAFRPSEAPWRGYGPDLTKEHEPWFETEIGYFSLRRPELDPQDFVFDNVGNPLLSYSDLQGKHGPGLIAKLDFLNVIDQGWNFQLGYIGSHNMQFNSVVSATPVVTPVFYGGVPATPSTRYRIEYETDLNSAEVNTNVRLFGRMKGLVGFRYLGTRDRYDIIDSVNSTPTIRRGFFSEIENDAFGGQVGLEGTLFQWRHLTVLGSIKWGLLSNEARGSANAANSSGAPIRTQSEGRSTTKILDYFLGGNHQLAKWLGIYGGYQGLYAESLAFGPTQSRDQSLFQPVNDVTFQSGLWNGFRLGAILTW